MLHTLPKLGQRIMLLCTRVFCTWILHRCVSRADRIQNSTGMPKVPISTGNECSLRAPMVHCNYEVQVLRRSQTHITHTLRVVQVSPKTDVNIKASGTGSMEPRVLLSGTHAELSRPNRSHATERRPAELWGFSAEGLGTMGTSHDVGRLRS